MSDHNLLVEYASNHPPTYMLVAAYLGVKPQEQQATWETESWESFISRWTSTPGAGISNG